MTTIALRAAVVMLALLTGHAAIAQTSTLTITHFGNGSGTVTSAPAGIHCGADCSEAFANGTVVSLTATPASGSTFVGWTGGCTGAGACSVTMNASITVTAVFALNQHTLTVVKSGLGTGTVTSSPAGINCGADCSEPFNHGNVISLTATPGSNSTFAGWSGGGCTGTGSCNVHITSATSVTATFNTTLPVLTVSLVGTGAGVVSSSPAGINCGSDCVQPYPVGTTVTLTPLPNFGSTFTGWSGACSGTAPCTLTVNATATAIANFTLTSAVLTVNHTGAGSGITTSSPSGINCPTTCSFLFPIGQVVSLAAVPSVGSFFDSFSGVDSAGANIASVTMNTHRTVNINYHCAADFNASGGISVQDIFDFLEAYFAGCP